MVDAARRLHRNEGPAGGNRTATHRSSWLDRRCTAANMSSRGRELIAIAPACAVALAIPAVIIGSATAALIVIVVTLGLPGVILAQRRHRRRDAIAAAVPFMLDALGRSMRGGASLAGAMRRSAETTPAPLASGLDTLASSLDLGQPLDHAWHALATRENSTQLQGVAALMTLLDVGERGGATALENMARSLRQHAALHRETRALVAQAELSMRVLAALPAGFVVLGLAFGNDSSMTLFTTTFGRLCLVVGAGLEAAGLVWMKTLLRRVML